MTGGTDTERWIESIVGLSTYASALMRRRSLPGVLERARARLHPSDLIGDAVSSALIAPINESSIPGISSSRETVRGMATMLEPVERFGVDDLRRFAVRHHDAVDAMLPACLEAEGTIRSLRATIKREGDMRDIVGYLDGVSGRSGRRNDGWGTYATNAGERDDADRPGMTAIRLSPAAVFAVHAARHLIAAPLLAPDDAGDEAICDMAAVGWIPAYVMKRPRIPPHHAPSDTPGMVLAAMGDDAWPRMAHIDPAALTWMMGPDMAPAMEAEGACMYWHGMTDASPYDIAWASAVASGAYDSMNGHDMAVLCEAAGDLVISMGFGPDTPVPVPKPRHIIGISNMAGMKPMRRWVRMAFVLPADPDSMPTDPADDSPARHAYRMGAESPAWPLARPGVIGMSSFLDRPDSTDQADGVLRSVISRPHCHGMIGEDGIISAKRILEAPQWEQVGEADRLRAILLVETMNGMTRSLDRAFPKSVIMDAMSMIGEYPDDFVLACLEGGRTEDHRKQRTQGAEVR